VLLSTITYTVISYSLRLQMYKGMGFEPVLDKDGVVSKMLVRESRFNVFFIYPLLTFRGQDQNREMYTVLSSTIKNPDSNTQSCYGNSPHHEHPSPTCFLRVSVGLL
jgi:hypothetical protein